MADPDSPGAVRRFFRWLFSPSARWSVFVLLLVGVVVGAVSVVGTQVAVAVTGTDEFCGTACHSHKSFVYPEHKASIHYTNRVGVRAMCVDCHVPHTYPAKLIYKARAGVTDALAEFRGVISTQEKFANERWRMANIVWDEMREDNSANCRSCHDAAAMNTDEQSKGAVKAHKKFAAGESTCIDCHTGVAHPDPEDPKAPATAAPEAAASAAASATGG